MSSLLSNLIQATSAILNIEPRQHLFDQSNSSFPQSFPTYFVSDSQGVLIICSCTILSPLPSLRNLLYRSRSHTVARAGLLRRRGFWLRWKKNWIGCSSYTQFALRPSENKVRLDYCEISGIQPTTKKFIRRFSGMKHARLYMLNHRYLSAALVCKWFR